MPARSKWTRLEVVTTSGHKGHFIDGFVIKPETPEVPAPRRMIRQSFTCHFEITPMQQEQWDRLLLFVLVTTAFPWYKLN